jgi:hypothetical protein
MSLPGCLRLPGCFEPLWSAVHRSAEPLRRNGVALSVSNSAAAANGTHRGTARQANGPSMPNSRGMAHCDRYTFANLAQNEFPHYAQPGRRACRRQYNDTAHQGS